MLAYSILFQEISAKPIHKPINDVSKLLIKIPQGTRKRFVVLQDCLNLLPKSENVS